MTNGLNPDVTLCVYKCFINFAASQGLSQYASQNLTRPSISNVIWILSSDTISLLSQLILNSEATMLSRMICCKPYHAALTICMKIEETCC